MGNLENLTKFITPAVLGLTVLAITTSKGEKASKKAGDKADDTATAIITWFGGTAASALFGCLTGLGFAAVATVAREVLVNSPATLQNEGMKSALILGAATAIKFKKQPWTEGLKILAAAGAVGLAVEQYIAL